MLKNEKIICISSIDWDFIWQGHQEIMSTLAKNDNRILFIENTGVRAPGVRDIPRLKKRIKNYFKGIKGIRKEMDNLYIFSPIVLPFPYSWFARKINKFLLLSVLKRWMKIMDFADPIVWTFLPTGITIDIIDNIDKKLVIYYCIDNFSVSSSSAKKVKVTEKKLLEKADLVFTTSKALYDYCFRHNVNVNIFPFGVNIDNFEKVRINDTEIPQELKDINKPIVGYVGGIHKWLNQNLIKFLANSYPDYSFVFVGPLQTDISSLAEVKNIFFLGKKNHSELSLLIKNFSVAVIPYHITDYTKNVYPTKLNEYLAMGRPVVSTDLPEVEIFNQKHRDIVYIGKNSEEFTESLRKALEDDNEDLRSRRIEVARQNSWQSRIEEMSGLIEKAIDKKALDTEKMWKENLLYFYRTAQRKLSRLTIGAFLVYLLLFYTPFVWFLAKPLKIQDAPQKADAIVVFAGGVGESGRAGQGYEERVEYAVRLYKEGYAKRLVFSSGYMYIFKEPLVMKALAVSLGVPDNVIILEDRGANTYENIKFVTEVLNEKGWNRILLVSSPYHMRRASLVFDKITKKIKTYYTPIPKSIFYSQEDRDSYGRKIWKKVNMEQIKGIFHEYLSIVYYVWKGYI